MSSANSESFTLFLHFGLLLFHFRRRQWQPNSSTLAWKIPWTEKPGGLQSMGSLRVGHDWVTSLSLFTFLHWRRKWQPTPVFLPGEPQARGASWADIYGVTQSQTRLKWLSSSSSISFSSLIAVAKTSKTMMNSSGESGHPCLVSDFRENAFSFSSLRIMCGFVIYSFYYVEVCSFYSCFLESFLS